MNSSVAFSLISAGIAAFVSAAVWRYIRRLQGTVQRLRQEIAALERDRAARPSPRVAFEFNANTREALLHVTNDGGDAEMRAPLAIEGALATQLEGDVSAVWLDGGGATAVIRRGETQTLRLAKLDLSVFPYAQWEIFVDGPANAGHYVEGPPSAFARSASTFAKAPADKTADKEGGPHRSVRAMHTSMIGGNPDTHAPAMFVQVALLTTPDAVAPPPQCTVVLQPFEAVRLRPL